MPKMRRGLTNDQAYPSTDPVYLSLNEETASSRVRLTLLRNADARSPTTYWDARSRGGVWISLSIWSSWGGASPGLRAGCHPGDRPGAVREPDRSIPGADGAGPPHIEVRSMASVTVPSA